MKFSVELRDAQARAGRQLIFEHPAFALSWKLPCLNRLRGLKGANEVVFHACRFGMRLKDKGGEALAYKPTRICANAVAIAEKLDRKRQRDHRRVRLESGRPALVARRPEALQDAFIDGLLVEEAKDENIEMKLMQLTKYPDARDPEEEEDIRRSSIGVGDVIGKRVDPVLVKRARAEEIKGFEDFKVR